MNYQKDLKKGWKDASKISQYRYQASKTIFMYMSFLFFLNYFLVAARIYDVIFTKTLFPFFIGFIFSLFLFLFFLIMVKLRKKA